MTTRDLLDFLQTELAFVELGGYEHNRSASWRPSLIFEDSPGCLNYAHTVERRSCSECPLLKLVPQPHRLEKVPCRHIPMTKDGRTLESLYRTATNEETLSIVRSWLRMTIAQLKRELDLHSLDRPA